MQFQLFTGEYVQRLTQGDPETEHHFIGYFSELLSIKLRRTLRSYHAIEDVRQETFLRVFRTLRSRGLASPERLGAFVNGVCANVLAEHYRSATRHPPVPGGKVDAPGSGPDPEYECVTEERKRCVRHVLGTLPARDREILSLIFLEEQEKDEVCRLYRVDRNHLRVLLHRAKNRFREALPRTNVAASGATLV